MNTAEVLEMEQPAAVPTPPKRAPVYALDGLRMFAALAVVCFHTRAIRYPGGIFGVEIFFALSGFLLTGTLVKEYLQQGSISISDFYIRRIRRLIPALAVLLLAFATIKFIQEREFDNIVKQVGIALFGLTNWLRVSGMSVARELAHLWSLAIEFQLCLLLAPLVYLVITRWKTAESVAICLLLVTIAVQIERAVLISKDVPLRWLYNRTDLRLDVFAFAGAIRALLYGQSPYALSFKAFLTKHGAKIALTGLMVNILIAWTVRYADILGSSLIHLTVVLSSVFLVAGLNSSPQGILSKFFSTTVVRFFGQISYGIYLWHYLIIRTVPLKGYPYIGRAAIVFVLASILGALSYYIVEKPLIRRRKEGSGGGLKQLSKLKSLN